MDENFIDQRLMEKADFSERNSHFQYTPRIAHVSSFLRVRSEIQTKFQPQTVFSSSGLAALLLLKNEW